MHVLATFSMHACVTLNFHCLVLGSTIGCTLFTSLFVLMKAALKISFKNQLKTQLARCKNGNLPYHECE